MSRTDTAGLVCSGGCIGRAGRSDQPPASALTTLAFAIAWLERRGIAMRPA